MAGKTPQLAPWPVPADVPLSTSKAAFRGHSRVLRYGSEPGNQQHLLWPPGRIRRGKHPAGKGSAKILRPQLCTGEAKGSGEDVALPGLQTRRPEVTMAGECNGSC